ncbi:unnamed protein product [Lactuca virosa]|uniref:ESF1 RRM domain-containing protein n=1 Tax=Lactuca virosa TaxID=75947 RepID=A0AAU9LXJ3_9ASTR|nr:unnamed protein product [Lactuca virosa]
MKEEAVRGPVGLFDEDDDNDKLRAYELERLWYYVAVVVCDSVATADYLYKSCDGIEFERSSNMLDLRFIQDSMEFKHPPRDVATRAPANYEGIDFQTRALQLSKVDLTWDENEPRRSKKLKRKINVHQESEYVKDEEELKEFIASSESESDEDDENHGKRQKTDTYRALLQSQSGDEYEYEYEYEYEDGMEMEMEVTFNTGLEALSKKILEKKKTKKNPKQFGTHLSARKKKKRKLEKRNPWIPV